MATAAVREARGLQLIALGEEELERAGLAARPGRNIQVEDGAEVAGRDLGRVGRAVGGVRVLGTDGDDEAWRDVFGREIGGTGRFGGALQ